MRALAACLCAATAASAAAAAAVPYALRVDLHDAQQQGAIFIPLDSQTGVASNVSVAWALPAAGGGGGGDWSLRVTTPLSAGNASAWATVVSLSGPGGGAQAAAFPRSALRAATAYDVAVRVDGGAWSQALRFYTSASPAAHWAATAPVWPAKCAGGGGPAQPRFAAFRGAARLAPLPPAADGILSALVYATAAPPIYGDPWNVTKLFSGFKLYANGTLAGMGPGHAACGPYAMSSCAAVQPADGFDLTAMARASAAAGSPLALAATAYGLAQPEFAVAPAFQLVLVVRYSPAGSAPDAIFGTAAGGGLMQALDADGVYAPAGNKDSGWYEQPEENINTLCLPGAGGTPLAGCPAPYNACGWSAPVAAPGAFGDYAKPGSALPLAGKATQAVQLTARVGWASVTQLGTGWWLLDPGVELQGGFALQLAAGAAAPNGMRAVVQMSDELMANGSAMWNTRAGMHYRDVWQLPAPGAPGVAAWHLEAAHHEVCEFRYVELQLSDAATGAPLDLAIGGDIEAWLWRAHYRHSPAGAAVVTTSSPDLDAVFALAAFTLTTTTMDIYSDSNTRQRSFDCMADNNVAALAHYSTTTELALPRMMSAQQMAIGDNGYISGNWADWTVLPGLSVVYDALYTGDVSFAAAYWPALLANHTYAWAVRANGLIHVDGLGALVDTSGGDDDGFQDSAYNAVVQAWAHLAMRRMAQLGRWLGRTADAAALDATADALRAAFRAAMVNGTAGDAMRAVCDGLCASTPHQAVHSTFYALYAGLFADDAAATTAAAAYVRARAAEDAIVGIPCGAYPVQFLLAALYADGGDHGAAAHAVLTATTHHSYLHMMQAYGATATMECWTPEELPNLSFSHVWSSSPSIIVPQFFFGLQPTAPGFATFDVRPQPGPVRSGSATLPSVRGPISIAFSQTVPGGPGGCFTLDISSPGGTVARAFLPRWGAAVAVKLDGQPVAAVDDGDYARVDGIAPGAHSLTSC